MKKYPAYRIAEENGRIEGRLADLPLEDPQDGEVLIRVRFSSINYKDALAATRPGVARVYPVTGGLDCAGVVEKSGDPRFRIGDEVVATGYGFGTTRDGGFATYLRAPADWVVHRPVALSLFETMAIGTAGFTAALALTRLEENGLTPGRGPVAVTGATGGVGTLAVDILSGCGYAVTAITGKPERAGWLRLLGAAEVLDRAALDHSANALEPMRFAGAFDAAGGGMLPWLLRRMQQQAAVAAFGMAAGSNLDMSIMPFILRGVSLLGITSSNCPMSRRENIWQHLAIDMRPRHLRDITHTVDLQSINDAFASMLAGNSTGHIVVVLPE